MNNTTIEEIAEFKSKFPQMNIKEKVIWLKEIHDEYVEAVRYSFFAGDDFLSGTDSISRINIVFYMNQLVGCLSVLEIKGFEVEVGNQLLKDGYSDLFLILNVLNYL